ncbi:hypothetical protein C4564_03565 [Candidatus Microgenomates bacterium]|nr:MAG: hypothetical protein C4564_03565 [Candidatus Microgenomates bacterium]
MDQNSAVLLYVLGFVAAAIGIGLSLDQFRNRIGIFATWYWYLYWAPGLLLVVMSIAAGATAATLVGIFITIMLMTLMWFVVVAWGAIGFVGWFANLFIR